uniref:BypB n=1 Tax=Agaricomycetes sp. TaxID=1709932 RepID=A0A1L3MYY3_9AGAM|nr:BypB [Agaricomycetes sp.]
MNTLLKDPQFFPQISISTPVDSDWPGGVTYASVRKAVNSLLGCGFIHGPSSAYSVKQDDGLALYDILTEVLPPMSSRTAHLWTRVARPFAQMLHTSQMSLATQCTFLLFLYSRVLGFLGPEKQSDPPACLTLDGSPIEFSWIIPNKKTVKGKSNRNIRCVMEPFDPRGSGTPLKGTSVLKYLASYAGSLGGVVRCEWDGMFWVESAEKFFFPQHHHGDYVPDGCRFAVGFDFTTSGIITLKAYFVSFEHPYWIQSPETFKSLSPICMGAPDLSPLGTLAAQLNPVFAGSFKSFMDHVNSLNDGQRPVYEFTSMDCKSPGANRLKLYCRALARTNWSAVKEDFTLGGRICSTQMGEALPVFETLWKCIFPESYTSDQPLKESLTGAEDSDHPQNGLAYHYEFVPGDSKVYPKVYIPMRFYYASDLAGSRALEKFYNIVGIEGPEGGEQGPGWVEREVANAYNHRDLDKRSGCRTYISFGLRQGGWEVTSYFSPELFSPTEEKD